MTKVEMCENLGILGDVRQRLGANDEDDISFDADIEQMNRVEIIEAWCGWNLGDSSWARHILRFYEGLAGFGCEGKYEV